MTQEWWDAGTQRFACALRTRQTLVLAWPAPCLPPYLKCPCSVIWMLFLLFGPLMSLAQLVLSYLHIQCCYTPPAIFTSSFSPHFSGSNTAALSTAPKTSCLLVQLVFPLSRPCFHWFPCLQQLSRPCFPVSNNHSWLLSSHVLWFSI